MSLFCKTRVCFAKQEFILLSCNKIDETIKALKNKKQRGVKTVTREEQHNHVEIIFEVGKFPLRDV